MKTTQAWGWLAAGVLALGINGIYQDGGAAWAHRVVNGTIGRFAARSEAALATGRVDWFAEKTSAPRIETASCLVASTLSLLQSRWIHSKMRRAQEESGHLYLRTTTHDVAMARLEVQRDRMEAQRDLIEAQVARLQLTPVALNAMRISVPACARVRLTIPRADIPRTPMVRIAGPTQIELSNGPI